MKRMKYLIFCFIIGIPSFAQKTSFKDLSVFQFKAKLDSTPNKILIDLRTPDEVSKGIISDAIRLDYFRKDFEAEVAKLDRNKTYFLYCAAGGRSAETAELMVKLGFKEIYNLKDGFIGWKKQRMPVAPPK
jgi:phage shock protein E